MTALWVLSVLSPFCTAATSSTSNIDTAIVREFGNPQPVEIIGLPIGADGTPISTEEPFISRDSSFLFFNTGQNENNKDIHYAKLVDGKWVYQGEIGPGVNNKKEVQGNPSMDNNFNLFYVDSGAKSMIRIGKFSPKSGQLVSLGDFESVPKLKMQLFAQKVHANMGVEVSADGTVVFFSRATWDLNGLSPGELLESNILFVRKEGETYVFDEAEVKRIMKDINTSDLEYAESISSDGLELFFTKLELADLHSPPIRSTILRSTRDSVSAPFSKPEVIEAIGWSSFVEGPAISNDGTELYYHRHDGKKFRIYKVTR